MESNWRWGVAFWGFADSEYQLIARGLPPNDNILFAWAPDTPYDRIVALNIVPGQLPTYRGEVGFPGEDVRFPWLFEVEPD